MEHALKNSFHSSYPILFQGVKHSAVTALTIIVMVLRNSALCKSQPLQKLLSRTWTTIRSFFNNARDRLDTILRSLQVAYCLEAAQERRHSGLSQGHPSNELRHTFKQAGCFNNDSSTNMTQSYHMFDPLRRYENVLAI